MLMRSIIVAFALVLGTGSAMGAVCTEDLSREECIQRQIAGRERAAKHRLMLRIAKELAPFCAYDPETGTGVCTPPSEWFSVCEGDCTLEVPVR